MRQTITYVINPISEAAAFIAEFLGQNDATHVQKSRWMTYLQLLREELWFVGENPYVDNVYRSSYYMHYSARHRRYARDCARLHLFASAIEGEDLLTQAGREKLQRVYLGYIVIRPLPDSFIGRTMVSPRAFKESGDLLTCLTKSTATLAGLELQVYGFPHASQDGETMTCAETTIWSILEYFGSRYREYRTALPEDIAKSIDRLAFQRVLPSRGLNTQQLSIALKDFGFGSLIYDAKKLAGETGTFRRILGYYVESGIPVVITVGNDKLGHALVLTGHRKIEHPISAISETIRINGREIPMYDTADLMTAYIAMDDNRPPYQVVNFENPCKDYGPRFADVTIKQIVVPLYHRIFLEAITARKLAMDIVRERIRKMDSEHPWGNSLVFRFFLTSARSFKKRALSSDYPNDLKASIALLSLPKFVWVAEIGTLELYAQGRANGIVLLDATEGNHPSVDPLLCAINGRLVQLTIDGGEETIDLTPSDFCLYLNNLKGEWNSWKDS